MFLAALFIILRKMGKKCPSTKEQINKIGCMHTMECCLAIKRIEVLMHVQHG